MTAVDDHPVACWTCHLYTQKDNFIAKMMHETYVSPYKLTLSADWQHPLCVGQESNQVVVVDPANHKVLQKIEVGQRPHTVILSPDGKSAYASNQWADNIYRIDLGKGAVDTLVGGAGPAEW